MSDLSIVIVSHNARDGLRRCLAALPAGCGAVPWDAAVVDNASADGAPDVVAREFPGVRLLRNPENAGFARACNQGAASTRGKFLLFLNPDAEPEAGSLALMAAQMGARQGMGALGPRLCRPGGAPARSCFRFPSPWRPLLNFPFLPGWFSPGYPPDGHTERWGGPVDWLSGACLMVRRKAFEDTGRFDERYFLYFEDTDLCRRLGTKGWDVVFSPAARVAHAGGGSSAGMEPRLAVERQRSRLIYHGTHHPGARWLWERCAVAAAAAARSLLWAASGRLKRLAEERRILALAVKGASS